MPVSGKEYEIYGGGTSCYRICSSDNDPEEIYLDAGNGIINARPKTGSHVSILFSHLHLDHVVGLPFFRGLTEKDRIIDLYAVTKDGMDVEKALDTLFSPPYWPCRIKDYPATVQYFSPLKSFSIGAFQIQTLEISHPGSTTAYRLTQGGHSIVYATDYEHGGSSQQELIEFSKDADLLIYDGQYTQEEYPSHKGYGHSIPEIGLTVASQAGVKRILFTHFDPTHSDAFLTEWEARITQQAPTAAFAKVGDVIEI